jgi:hypothetical protein
VVVEFVMSTFLYLMDWLFTYQPLVAKVGYTGPMAASIVTARVQLILSNSHFITHAAQPYLENVVQVTT